MEPLCLSLPHPLVVSPFGEHSAAPFHVVFNPCLNMPLFSLEIRRNLSAGTILFPTQSDANRDDRP